MKGMTMGAQQKGFITVVSGLPRSGTSMMMRMLEKGGVPILTDGFRKADDDNPLGYYELEAVKQLDKDASWLPDAYNKVVKIIFAFLYYLPRDYRYKVLFMKRNLEDVVASQKVMLKHRQEADRVGDQQLIHLFQGQLLRLDAWIRHQDNFSVHYVDYDEVISDPAETALAISRFLGYPLDTEAMARAVDPSLHRNRSAAV